MNSFKELPTSISDRLDFALITKDGIDSDITGVKKYGKLTGWLLSWIGVSSRTPAGNYVNRNSFF